MIGTNRTYADLVTAFPPRPIQTEEQYQAVQKRIDLFLEREALTPDERDYLTILGMVLEAYETETEDEDGYELRGTELVEALLVEHGLRQKDLIDIFKTESIVSAVVNGRRGLTVEHIDKLARRFNLPHHLFFDPDTSNGRQGRDSRPDVRPAPS